MKMSQEIEAMFEIPEHHTAKVLIGGGTDHKNFAKVWSDMLDEKIIKDMDGNSSRLGLPMHPVLMLIIQGEDGHLHALISLPLQKWQAPMRVHDSIEDSKNVQRMVDWCAGFMEVFCMKNTITAIDVTNQKVMIGDPKDAAFGLEAIVKDVRPKKEVRTLTSIGSVDDILGQMSKPQIEKFEKKKTAPKKSTAKMTRVPVKDVVEEEKKADTEGEKLEKTRADQQAIFDKYGYAALKEMTDRMNIPILIKKSK